MRSRAAPRGAQLPSAARNGSGAGVVSSALSESTARAPRAAQLCPVWEGDLGVGSSVGAALAEHSYYRGIVRDEDIARASCSRRSEAVARPCGRSTGAQDVFAERKESGCWSWRRKDVREHDVAGNVDDVNVSNSASLAFSDIVPT